MRRKIYQKLIRDRIPEIIKKDNAVPKISLLDDKRYRIALKEKLMEEVKELLETKTDEEMLNELSDVLELIGCIASQHNITMKEVEKQRKKKKKERGGFEKKVFLEYIDESSS